jgi:alpha-tubulin suppressor-like RCC1 family protein/uncharacterized protein YjdB
MRSLSRALQPALLLALALSAAACDADGDGGSLGPQPIVSRVVVQPEVDTIFARDSLLASDAVQLQAAVIGFSGTALTEARVRWSTSDTSIVTVDSTGLVRPRRVGTATVTATSGGKEDEATVVVVYASTRLTITPLSQAPLLPGQTARTADTIFVRDPITAQNFTPLRALAIGPDGAPVTGLRYTWTSSNPNVATVDSAGNVSARSVGSTTITVTGGGLQASRAVTVASVVGSIRVSAPLTRVLTEDTLRLTATVLGRDTLPLADPRVRWTSSDPTIATIDTTGLARFLRRGTVRFTATSNFVSATTGTANNVADVSVLDRVFRSVEAGVDHTCSTIELGRVYCWGRRDLGQLGTALQDSTCFDTQPIPGGGSPIECSLVPKRATTALAFASVSAGGATSCGVLATGRAYCWGDGSIGQIGNGLTSGSVVPTLVTSALTFDTTAGAISVGGNHACGITSVARMVYCWGSDVFGQLGTQAVTVNSTTPIPAEVPSFPNGPGVQGVSAGYRHTCAVASSGQAFCWGRNTAGELGAGFVSEAIGVPRAVAGSFTFRSISSSSVALFPTGSPRVPLRPDSLAHTCGLTTDGRAVCWGANHFGQVGNGSSGDTVLTPTAVSAPVSFTQVSAGGGFTCALGTDRNIYCWGLNDASQLGATEAPGGASGRPVPVLGAVTLDADGRIVSAGPVSYVGVTAGRRHACGVVADGNVYCWGSDVLGALGSQLQARVQPRPMRVAKPL